LGLVDVSGSTNIVGTGTSASCTEVALAAALSQGGNIRFDCGTGPTTVTLTKPLAVAKATVLDGQGAVILDGGGQTRMFNVALGVAFTLQRLTFQKARVSDEGAVISAPFEGVKLHILDCTFKDNVCANTGQDIGGAAMATYEADIVISGSVFAGNRGSNGGAIRVISSNLTVVNSRFVQNVATGTGGNGAGGQGGIGGALYVDAVSDPKPAPLQLCGNVFEENQAGNQGGGAFVFFHTGQSGSVTSTSFLGNALTGPSGLGGGLYWQGGALTLSSSTFSKNASTLHAGGVFLGSGSPATMVNSTFAENTASATEGNAGALWTGDAKVTLRHLTVAGNTAHYGPGLFHGNDTTLIGSIFANNGGNQFGGKNCSGTALDGGGNVQFPSKDSACAAGILFADPRLGVLGDHGGPAPTLPLEAGSSALGLVTTGCPETDQRGFARTAPCDAGAFEL
jgi:hypothetical protein